MDVALAGVASPDFGLPIEVVPSAGAFVFGNRSSLRRGGGPLVPEAVVSTASILSSCELTR